MKPYSPRYRQTALYIALLAATVIMMAVTRRCGTSSPLEAVTSGGSSGDTVDVAVIYGPASYYLYADTLGGLNLDFLSAYSRQTGTPVKLWPVVNLEEAMEGLERHTYDMLASLPSDNIIKQRFLTTGSVFLDRMVLIQLADSSGETGIRSALDLAGKTVTIQKGSPAAARLRNLANEIGDSITIISEPSLSEEYLCMMVATGELPLAVVNEKTAQKMKLQYPGLSAGNPVSFTQFQVWALPREDSARLRMTNAWLENFRKTEEYRHLLDKYSLDN